MFLGEIKIKKLTQSEEDLLDVDQYGIPKQIPQNEISSITQTDNYQQGTDPNLVAYEISTGDITEEIRQELIKMGCEKEIIRDVCSCLRPIASRAIFLSNLEEQDILPMSQDLNQSVIEALEFSNTLSIHDKDTIIAMSYALILSSLRRPFQQGERKFLSKTSEVRTMLRDQTQQKKEGMFKQLIKW